MPVVRVEIVYTHSKLEAEPLAQEHAPIFSALLADWDAVNAEALALSDALSHAQAMIDSLDTRLNHLASRLQKATLVITRNNRKHAQYLRYFDKPPHVLMRPVLGAKLEKLKSFVPSLKASPHDALKVIGGELEALTKEATEAALKKLTLEGQRKDFYAMGAKKRLIDKVNAARKKLHGDLGKLAHEATGVPANFADQFFLRREPREAAEEPKEESVQGMKEEIAELEAALNDRKARLEQLIAEQELAAQREAKLAAEKAVLAELEKAAAEAAQKVALQKAKLQGAGA
jgi:DNA repair exonuclease SbcCD ATPase subunit